MIKISGEKRNRALDVAEISANCFAVGLFGYCLIYSIIAHFAGWESAINGYGAYDGFEILKRVGAFALALAPIILKWCGIRLPSSAIISYQLFMILTTFCGTFMGLYINTVWWDKFNHTLSGVLLGMAGLFFLNSLTKDADKVGAFGTFLYVVAFSVMCGTVWEIYEFLCDDLIGLNMQKYMNDITLEKYVGHAALMDTMGDIIVDAIGALIMGAISAIAVKKNRNFLRSFSVKLQGGFFDRREVISPDKADSDDDMESGNGKSDVI